MSQPDSVTTSDAQELRAGKNGSSSTAQPSRKAINYVRRLQNRAHYDEETVNSIVDASLVCHVAFTAPASLNGLETPEEWPIAMPMVHGRIGRVIYLHGYISGRLMKRLATADDALGQSAESGVGAEAGESTAGETDREETHKGPRTSMTFTIVDGLVFALSPFHNSMNYRSACVFGHARLVSDPEEKIEALRAITNHAFKLSGGGERYEESRPPNQSELHSTKVIAVEIEAASAKIRNHPVADDAGDVEDKELTQRLWTGVVKMETRFTEAEKMPYSPPEVPDYIHRMMAFKR